MIFHLGSKSIPSALCMLHSCREWPDRSHSPSREMYTTSNGFSEEHWQSPTWWLGCTSAREPQVPVREEMRAIHWSLCNSCTKRFWANYRILDPEDRHEWEDAEDVFPLYSQSRVRNNNIKILLSAIFMRSRTVGKKITAHCPLYIGLLWK